MGNPQVNLDQNISLELLLLLIYSVIIHRRFKYRGEDISVRTPLPTSSGVTKKQ